MSIEARKPLEASFSSRRFGAFPFRAFLLEDDRKKVSLFSLRSRAFSQNLFGFESAPQRLSPILEAVPLFATGWIRTGRGPCFSWGFLTF